MPEIDPTIIKSQILKRIQTFLDQGYFTDPRWDFDFKILCGPIIGQRMSFDVVIYDPTRVQADTSLLRIFK